MKCILDLARPYTAQKDGDHIQRLLQFDDDQLHCLEFTHVGSFDETAPWYTEGLSRNMQKYFREKLTASNYPTSADKSTDSFRPHQKCRRIHDSASLRSVRELAETPLYILVENQHSDGILVQTAIRLYAPKLLSDLLQKCQESRPILFEIRGAGGNGELPKMLTGKSGSVCNRLGRAQRRHQTKWSADPKRGG